MVHIVRAGHVQVICTSFYFFKAADQTRGRIPLKLCEPMANIGGQNPEGYRVISGTSSTCEEG